VIEQNAFISNRIAPSRLLNSAPLFSTSRLLDCSPHKHPCRSW
jgi:hypothetical protein